MMSSDELKSRLGEYLVKFESSTDELKKSLSELAEHSEEHKASIFKAVFANITKSTGDEEVLSPPIELSPEKLADVWSEFTTQLRHFRSLKLPEQIVESVYAINDDQINSYFEKLNNIHESLASHLYRIFMPVSLKHLLSQFSGKDSFFDMELEDITRVHFRNMRPDIDTIMMFASLDETILQAFAKTVNMTQPCYLEIIGSNLPDHHLVIEGLQDIIKKSRWPKVIFDKGMLIVHGNTGATSNYKPDQVNTTVIMLLDQALDELVLQKIPMTSISNDAFEELCKAIGNTKVKNLTFRFCEIFNEDMPDVRFDLLFSALSQANLEGIGFIYNGEDIQNNQEKIATLNNALAQSSSLKSISLSYIESNGSSWDRLLTTLPLATMQLTTGIGQNATHHSDDEIARTVTKLKCAESTRTLILNDASESALPLKAQIKLINSNPQLTQFIVDGSSHCLIEPLVNDEEELMTLSETDFALLEHDMVRFAVTTPECLTAIIKQVYLQHISELESIIYAEVFGCNINDKDARLALHRNASGLQEAELILLENQSKENASALNAFLPRLAKGPRLDVTFNIGALDTGTARYERHLQLKKAIGTRPVILPMSDDCRPLALRRTVSPEHLDPSMRTPAPFVKVALSFYQACNYFRWVDFGTCLVTTTSLMDGTWLLKHMPNTLNADHVDFLLQRIKSDMPTNDWRGELFLALSEQVIAQHKDGPLQPWEPLMRKLISLYDLSPNASKTDMYTKYQVTNVLFILQSKHHILEMLSTDTRAKLGAIKSRLVPVDAQTNMTKFKEGKAAEIHQAVLLATHGTLAAPPRQPSEQQSTSEEVSEQTKPRRYE